MGRAYIVHGAMELLGMTAFDATPTTNVFCGEATIENKQQYFDDLIGQFVDKYVIPTAHNIDISKGSDYVKNYGTSFIFLTTMLLQMKDTAKEADGGRNLLNQKLLLNIFRTKDTQSKYAKEMFVAISQYECLLTPRLAEEFKWGYFVNWRGGEGNNIEDDLCQEISNGIGKKMVKRLGENKTLAALSSICSAVGGIKEIMDNYDDSIKLKKQSSWHAKVDRLKEEKEMIKDLLKLKPFRHQKDRKHKSFPKMKQHHKQIPHLVEKMHRRISGNIKQ